MPGLPGKVQNLTCLQCAFFVRCTRKARKAGCVNMISRSNPGSIFQDWLIKRVQLVPVGWVVNPDPLASPNLHNNYFIKADALQCCIAGSIKLRGTATRKIQETTDKPVTGSSNAAYFCKKISDSTKSLS